MLNLKFHLLIGTVLLLSTSSILHAQKTCWDNLDWGTQEKSFVKPEWAKTIIPNSLTSYVEVEEIKDGQIRRRYTFVGGELADFAMSVYSITLSRERLRSFAWSSCYERLGQPIEELSDLIFWDGQKIQSMVTGGNKSGTYWINATHNKHLALILKSVAYIPKIF